MSGALLSIEDLTVQFRTARGVLTAVDRVSFAIAPGEALALVGESGSGKTVTAKAILGLLPAPEARFAGGRVMWRGEDLARAGERRLREVRGAEAAMVFQEPMSALNPVMTAGDQITEAVALRRGLSRRERRELAVRLLAQVKIASPEQRAGDYPHQLSGGMRQRVMIAAALAGDPKLLIADEPTTALDVTVQKEILELLAELRCEREMALLLITHDLAIVGEVCDRVAVMYAGELVEVGAVADVFARPRHPYTAGLLRSIPRPRSEGGGGASKRLFAIPGLVPDLANLPSGCRFRDRCEKAEEKCAREAPQFVDGVRCHFPNEVSS